MMNKQGKVIVILGAMYASKTTSLLNYLNRAKIAKKEVILFKPRIDNRYSEDNVVTHDGATFPATVIDSHKEIQDLVGEAEVVAVEELQFFDVDIWRVINNLARLGKTVIAAGLSTDFMGNPFETSARVAMIADEIEKLSAVCVSCGEDATWTQMVVDGVEVTDGDRVQVGGSELYIPRCRRCFVR